METSILYMDYKSLMRKPIQIDLLMERTATSSLHTPFNTATTLSQFLPYSPRV
uniref:Uncharacterized protein n=1 Tax=Utricularia reniformis TaxID=192314 RepID=A0A1Y0AZ62_9LAMI|nr:hypothetical protein AEK19_MT0183 [Utricularia reniformis]ART30465.1 hypothetical protein AEK19_MT0183 [Utricularia reniformis]